MSVLSKISKLFVTGKDIQPLIEGKVYMDRRKTSVLSSLTPEQLQVLKYVFTRGMKVVTYTSQRKKSGMSTVLYLICYLVSKYVDREVNIIVLYEHGVSPKFTKQFDTLLRANQRVYESRYIIDDNIHYGLEYDCLDSCHISVYNIDDFFTKKKHIHVSPNTIVLLDDYEYMTQSNKQLCIDKLGNVSQTVMITSP